MSDDKPVDPRATPGSFEKIGDAYVRLDEPTVGASAPAPTLDACPTQALASARAIAAANEESGFPVPPQVQAVIDAADAEQLGEDAKAAAAQERAAAAEAKRIATAEAKAAAAAGGQPKPQQNKE